MGSRGGGEGGVGVRDQQVIGDERDGFVGVELLVDAMHVHLEASRSDLKEEISA